MSEFSRSGPPLHDKGMQEAASDRQRQLQEEADRTRQMEPRQPGDRASRLGYLIVLLGSAGFVVSCFFPYFGSAFGGESFTTSFYRVVVLLPVGVVAHIGGFLLLFVGVITVASISMLELRSPRRSWTFAAVTAAVVVWASTWIGTMLQTYELALSHEIGYWALAVSIGVVVPGTAIAAKDTLQAGRHS